MGSLKCLLSTHHHPSPQLLDLTPVSLTATGTVLFAGLKVN